MQAYRAISVSKFAPHADQHLPAPGPTPWRCRRLRPRPTCGDFFCPVGTNVLKIQCAAVQGCRVNHAGCRAAARTTYPAILGGSKISSGSASTSISASASSVETRPQVVSASPVVLALRTISSHPPQRHSMILLRSYSGMNASIASMSLRHIASRSTRCTALQSAGEVCPFARYGAYCRRFLLPKPSLATRGFVMSLNLSMQRTTVPWCWPRSDSSRIGSPRRLSNQPSVAASRPVEVHRPTRNDTSKP